MKNLLCVIIASLALLLLAITIGAGLFLSESDSETEQIESESRYISFCPSGDLSGDPITGQWKNTDDNTVYLEINTDGTWRTRYESGADFWRDNLTNLNGGWYADGRIGSPSFHLDESGDLLEEHGVAYDGTRYVKTYVRANVLVNAVSKMHSSADLILHGLI